MKIQGLGHAFLLGPGPSAERRIRHTLAKREQNLADYFTKHHPPARHIQMRPIYLHMDHLTPVNTPDCRGVLILDSGLTESHEYGPGASQVCDSCPARELARQAKVAVSDSLQASSHYR
jgi:hypothetical protein